MPNLPPDSQPAYRVYVTYQSGMTETYDAYKVTYTRRGLSMAHTRGNILVCDDEFKKLEIAHA